MLLDMLLILVLIICFITDLKYQKIYNKVIFPSLILAVTINFIFSGFDGLKMSLTGFAVGFIILLIPYYLGGIAAGDVKLISLIGAIKGWVFVVNTALYMSITGGIMAIGVIVFHKEGAKFFKNFLPWIFSLINGIKFKFELPAEAFLKKYPYGLAIVSGALICLFFKEAWII